MVDVLKQQEATPVSYPEFTGELSVPASRIDSAALWERIEAYTSHRFTEREVVWTFEGCEDEEWQPSLTPLVSHTAEKWESGAWVAVTLSEGPLGLCLPSDGVFRVTAQVGAGPVPAAVSEAFRRLAENLAGWFAYGDAVDATGVDKFGSGGVSRQNFRFTSNEGDGIGSDLDLSFDGSPSWRARAMQESGAADLLRPYRRA